MKRPAQGVMLGIAIAFVVGLFLFLHHSTAESISIAFEIPKERASRAVSGLLSGTVLVMMVTHVWRKLWTTKPGDPPAASCAASWPPAW